MASDRKLFSAAMDKRDLLYKESCFSVPSSEGNLVVLCSTVGAYDDDTGAGQKYNRRDAKTFRKEAFRILDYHLASGLKAELIYNPTRDHINEVLKDDQISDIVTIGNGSLSSFWLHDEASETVFYDWKMAQR